MPAPEPLSVRLWRQVDKSGSCWLWQGCIRSDGYGSIGSGKSSQRVHRVSYELLVGPIPDGLVLDHLCRVRNCVNPEHLEPVTLQENNRRGIAGKARSERTHCPHGHEFTPENTVWKKGRNKPYRKCRQCIAASDKRRYLRSNQLGNWPAQPSA